MRLAVDGLFQSALAPLAVALLAFSLPGIVFWPYFTGLVLLAVGLPFLIKNEVPQAYGLDKIMPFGRLFYAMPMAVFGTEHFVFTPAVADMVPRWIPGHLFWVYFAGIALIAAALSIMMKKYSQLAATLLGVMLFLFVVLISVPRIVANPTDRFAWAVGLRDLAFSGGAFAFAGTQANVPPTSGLLSLVNLGRFFVAIPVLVFGVEHFLHPDFAPGVPLNKLTPAYIPARLLWAYLAGAVLIPAGMYHPEQKSSLGGNLSWSHDSSSRADYLRAHLSRQPLEHRERAQLFRRYPGLRRCRAASSRRNAKRGSTPCLKEIHLACRTFFLSWKEC